METPQEDLPLSQLIPKLDKAWGKPMGHLQLCHGVGWRELRKQGNTLRAQSYRLKEDLFKDVPWESLCECHKISELASAYDRMLVVGVQVKKLLNILDENPNDQSTYDELLVVIVEMHTQCVGLINAKSTTCMQGDGI